MAKFRQKNFFWGGALMVGTTVAQMAQASGQAKEAQEQAEAAIKAQKRENTKLVNALNNLAKNNPQAGAQAGQLVGSQKSFSKAAIFNKAGRFVKDVIGSVGSGVKEVSKGGITEIKKTSKGLGLVGKTVISLGSAGLATGLASYGLDKAITHDARKNGIMPAKNTTTPNNSNTQQRSYSVASIVSKGAEYAKKGIKYAGSKQNLKTAAGWAVPIVGFTGLGYLANRQQMKEQGAAQNSTISQEQRSYSVMGNVGKVIAGKWRSATKNWKGMQTITGFLSNTASFGKFGRREVQAFGDRLRQSDKGAWANKLGNFIKKNPNAANLGAAGIGTAVIGGAMNTGEKLVKKTAEKFDKDAYAYEKFKNQPVQ